MAEVKWIKLIVGMFDGNSFKRIKKAKIGGESYRDKLTAVWFELMDFAGKCNAGGQLIENPEIPFSSIEDIAIMIDREPDELNLCMQFYISNHMVTVIDDVYLLANWSKYQNTEKMQEIREQNRLRKQKQRERQLNCEQKQAICEQSHVTSRDCHVTVTLQNKKEDTELRNNTILSGKPDHLSEKAAKIIARLNEKTGANYLSTTKSTRQHIHARLEEGFTVEDFYTVIDAKAAEWMGDPKMEPYLRPDTLFCTKFEGYLQAAKRSTSGGGVWAREEQDDLDFVK